MTYAVLIPAYRPEGLFRSLIQQLANVNFNPIIIVDDGSGSDFAAIFAAVAELPGVVVLRHAVNLGKGAALKTGLNYFLLQKNDLAGVITADADGQHRVDDILAVAKRME